MKGYFSISNQHSTFSIQHFQPPPRGVGPSFSHLCAVLFSFISIAPSIVTMFLDSGLAKSSSRPPAARSTSQRQPPEITSQPGVEHEPCGQTVRARESPLARSPPPLVIPPNPRRPRPRRRE